ncbi:MAG: sugar phosphate isomerase/epimerase family protein [Terrimicrobiaceae bacterium]|nr:sugar phosphate isomerase/epimerase family protein [Terrimicrobiaceae bacterium]
MRAGLVSITFRSLSPADVARLTREAGLSSIEWGGDVHVPHGKPEIAEEVARLTRAAGLSVAAYGSYYRLAASPAEGPDFSGVLESAMALGAPSIRVWAGNRGSADADSVWRQAVADDALRCADLAARAGIPICYEFHGGTLTDTLDSTLSLLESTDHPFIRTLWQAPVGSAREANLAAIEALAGRLAHVHVFHWGSAGWKNRHPLRDGMDVWKSYVAKLREVGFDGDLLLEFVANDDPARLASDAAALRELINPET